MDNLENLENLLNFVEVREKSWKSHGIYSFVPMIFSNHGRQFKGNSSNLRQVKSPDLTMGTMCVIALSLVTLCLKLNFCGFGPGKVMENMGKIWEKLWKSH